MTTPLAGITVIDFGQIFQGPYATLLMAKAGANVIKIEPPHGEPGRRRAAPGKSTTLPVAMLNANKRAITLNLKSERGRALLHQMMERADVLLENFSPGTMDGLGVGYEVLKAINPRLVYATGSGWDYRSGPRQPGDGFHHPGTVRHHERHRLPDGPPVKAGPTLVDFMGGIHLYAAVVTALFHRASARAWDSLSKWRCRRLYSSLASSMEYYVRTGGIPPRTGNRQSALASAPYNAFPTADGWVAIHVVTEAHWKNLAKAMGRAELADDPRFATNAARVANLEATDDAVAAWTRTLGKMEVFAAAKRYRIPCAPVRTVPEVMNDPHMHGRGMLERIDHPELGNIVVPTRRCAARRGQVKTPPSPTIGQHNQEVWEAGLDCRRMSWRPKTQGSSDPCHRRLADRQLPADDGAGQELGQQAIRRRSNFPGTTPVFIPMPPH
jgi:crotonobetainyl-CoA:carnitine CoA-transferase CaiB-like acyl-CoA transferase